MFFQWWVELLIILFLAGITGALFLLIVLTVQSVISSHKDIKHDNIVDECITAILQNEYEDCFTHQDMIDKTISTLENVKEEPPKIKKVNEEKLPDWRKEMWG